MRRPAIVVALLVLGACSSSGSTAATQRPLRTTESVNAAVLPALVGKWELKRTCTAIVEALTKAGLTDLVPQTIGETIKIPENAPLPRSWNPAHPCADARPPTEHSHTFWPDGSFNSYDQNDQQVDDGSYILINDHTFIFPGAVPVTVHYQVRGDTITFDPVIPKNCSTRRCRGTIAWAFSVAYPGQRWIRVTSGNNVPAGSGSSG